MSETEQNVSLPGNTATTAEELSNRPPQTVHASTAREAVATTASLRGMPAAEMLRNSATGKDPASLSPSVSKLQLMVVDDDLPVLKACCEIAAGMGFAVHAAGTAERARELVQMYALDVVLMDLKMPSGGLALLEEIRVKRPRSAIVVMTAFATVASAVEAMRIGASDYLTKPFAMDELTSVLERAGQRRNFELESQRLQQRLQDQKDHGILIGQSPEMEKLYRIVQKVAFSSHPVLILGESGTGKETVARTIHNSGPNAGKRFTVLEYGQTPSTEMESELFGYDREPFTGSSRSKHGLLTSEEGGTVYLDGVNELPLDLQAKLMRALQDKQVRQPGSTQGLPVTVRLLASSNRNLSALVDAGQFRKDLYYRLNVVSLRIPPLRERREDIALLAEHFLERIRRESGVAYRFAADAMRVLLDYDWPGNVRELEAAVERACALSSGPVLHMTDLPAQLQGVAIADDKAKVVRVDERISKEHEVAATTRPAMPIVSIAELEREAILNTIRQLHGDKLMAAKLLGIGKTTLYRKLKEYGISDS